MMMSPNSVGCTNFLMGGQYYPGKDKNRRHLRRKTLWYRIFWSSPFRRGLSALIILYLVLVYIVNPALNALLYYGKVLSNHIDDDGTRENSVVQNPDGVHGENVSIKERFKHLKPLHVAREDAQKLMKRLNELKHDKVNVETRNKIMQKLIPEWFPKAGKVEKSKQDKTVYENIKQDKHEEEEKEQEEAEENVSSANHVDGHGTDDITGGGQRALRTLQNKAEHYKHSSCPRDVNDISTTLVVQSTLDRLPIMNITCNRWKGPIVAVVYLLAGQEEGSNVWNETVQTYTKSCPQLRLMPYVGSSHDEQKLQYPINKLRNIGLDHVVTSYVLVLDIDLIPSTGLDEALNHAITLALDTRLDDDGNRGLDPKDAMVVPAFERKISTPCESLQDCLNQSLQNEDFIPHSMEDLRYCVEKQQCIVFQSDVNWEGHFDTQSTSWLEKNDSSSLTTIECFHSQRYEPYVAIPWCPLEENAKQRLALHAPRSPYYDERFHGYGKNKIQQIAHLRQSGYTFTTMPATGFVIHLPHPESETKEAWNDKMNYDLHVQMDRLYPQYLEELYNQYAHAFVETKLCK